MLASHRQTAARFGYRAGFGPLLALVAACSVMLVSSFDQSSVDRTNEISKSILGFYQELLSTPASGRAAMGGELRAKQGDIETAIRVHLLREQARTMNTEGAKIAEDLLASWQTFSASHLSSGETVLTDATLNVERQVLERELRSAFVAEESKKLATPSPK
jgi:hypothetical protein